MSFFVRRLGWVVALAGLVVLGAGCSRKDMLVLVVPDAAQFSGLSDQETLEDTPTDVIHFRLSDDDTLLSEVVLSAETGDADLIPEDNIVLGGEGENRTLVLTPALNQFGSTTITLTARDPEATGTVSFELVVHPVNDAPIAEDLQVELDLEGSTAITLAGTDVEGDALTFEVVEGPAEGTLSGTPPELVYTPGTELSGVDSFTYKANDGELDSAPATVRVYVANSLPVGAGETYTTAGACPVVAFPESGLLANDTDAEGDPLEAILREGPSRGSLELNPDGSFTYTPNLPVEGDDGFTYVVSDGLRTTEPYAVTISVDLDGILVDLPEDGFVADGRCSLREAIQAANEDETVDGCEARDGAARILFGLPLGTLTLSEAGGDEDSNQTGDLDIHKSLTMVGCGPEGTIIDAAGLDRVMQIHGEIEVRLEELTLSGGAVVGQYGGGIYNEGTLVLAGASLRDNHATGSVGTDGNSPGGGGGGGGAPGFGGGIYNSGTVTWAESTSVCSMVHNTVSGGEGGRGMNNAGSFRGNGGRGAGPAGGAGGVVADGQGGGFASGGGGGGGGGARTPGGNSGAGGAGGFGGGTGGVGCCSAGGGGGGGGGLGGAIFNHGGLVRLGLCYLEGNVAAGGAAGSNYFGGPVGQSGGGYGAGVFNNQGNVESGSAVFTENRAASEGPEVYHFIP